MIDIYNVDGTLLMQAELTSSAKREEEMSKSDYISLSWNADVKVILPVGAYILHAYKIDTVRSATAKFLLLEAYEPTQSDEQTWKYTPEFQHPKMILGKVPFYIWTKNSKNETIKSYVWSFVGTTKTLAGKLCDFLNNDIKFGNAGWTCVVTDDIANTVTVSFSDSDFISSLTAITNAIGDNCEWHIDYDNEIIYIGHVIIGDNATELTIGTNVGKVSVSSGTEDYYNCFAVFGGTRNITQINSKGENISSGDIRLQLNAGEGSILVDGATKAFTIDDYSTIDLRQDKTNEQRFTKVLDFSDIFPSMYTYVYNVRAREKYVYDSNATGADKRVPISYNDDGSVHEYKTFTVWYMRLAYPTTEKIDGKTLVNTTVDDGVTHYWYDFEITDDLKVNGKTLSCSFEANFNTDALSTPLAGRGDNGDYVGFELTYHDNDFSSHSSDDVDEGNFEIKAGDYEIIYQEDNDVYIPSNRDEMIVPHGESKPSYKCNITVLYNIAMADSYYVSAQQELLKEAKEEIARLLSDLDNYTFNSYPQTFDANNPCLQIGQRVKYDDGNGYALETRVLKLSTNLDYDCVQSITVGNKAIKGTLTQLKDDVEAIVASGGSSGSGGLSVNQMSNLIGRYGTKYFLSKTSDDTASGLITFKKGLVSNGDVDIDGFVHMTGDLDIDGGGMEVSDVAQFDDRVNIDNDLLVRGSATIAKDLTTKNLTVTGQAHFFELVIDKIKAAGGSYIFSAANSFNVLRVAEGTNVLRLYWLAESGGSGSMNTWEVGDQAVSMDFNRAKVGTTYEASNKYWWALVTATSGNTPESITEDGVTHDYHWIEVSTTDCAEGCTVTAEVGDAVAQWGSRGDDAKRQGSIMICAYKSPDAGVEAPCFVEYTGINSFTITEANRKNRIAYGGTVLKGSFTATSTGKDIATWLTEVQAKANKIASDGIITAGAEKAQIVADRKTFTAEYETFAEEYAPEEEISVAALTPGTGGVSNLYWTNYKTAYEKFMTATEKMCGDWIDQDTKLSDIGYTSATFNALYTKYYATRNELTKSRSDELEASIETIDGKIALAVTKNGLKTAGIDITDGKVVLDAAKTTVTGDLTIQGAITDSTSYVAQDGTWYAPNDTGVLTKQTDSLMGAGGLFVPIDMSAIKSVQIQTTDPSEVVDGTPTTKTAALVALPMYESVDLGNGTTMPAYMRSGTHVLIRNAFSLGFTQWSKSEDGWGDATLRKNIEGAAVYVCADPRLLAMSNYTGDTPTIPADGRDANGGFNTADFFKGCMYKDGRRGRWLALLPGQEVELVSAVSMWQSGTNAATPYLVWYVVGGEGLTWVDKTMSITPDGDGYTAYDAVFNADITGGEKMGVGSVDKYSDAFFAPSQMGDTSALAEQIQVTLGATDKPYITIG